MWRTGTGGQGQGTTPNLYISFLLHLARKPHPCLGEKLCFLYKNGLRVSTQDSKNLPEQNRVQILKLCLQRCLLLLLVFFKRSSKFSFNLTYFFSFWPCCSACRISVPQPGIKPVPPAMEAQSLNHWTAGEVPHKIFEECKVLALAYPLDLNLSLHRDFPCSPVVKTLSFYS